MKKFLIKNIIIILLSLLMSCTAGQSFDRLFPDTIIMNDGTQYRGLIIKNNAKEVVLQEKKTEITLSKAAIKRIDDTNSTMAYFADLVDSNKAPCWRMMVQDLRCNDAVKSFIQIPATTINKGYLKNVPYLSFHVNQRGEMNIYGDPNNPACVELGAYLRGARLKKFQELARSFFAGYISSRSGIATLYQLNLNSPKGNEKRLGCFIYKVMSPSEPEAHGGWWISIYNPVLLAKARVSDEEYHRITLPCHEVRTKDGLVRHDIEEKHGRFLNKSMMRWLGKIPGLRGFYRNGDDELRVVETPRSS
ncbi:MAG: hypothetical protein A3F67_03615 [Verrucomicrobia bacterium RIFCSPHIGHO2_12_FULL_41_10]|nr:MAG: hypothetical protein A3F67_03615 [Verrucomicrobia bacterium RIFCSPHIGHO2_12_FULL_41_10]HLB33240.1 hypothetical protein [Chthoniobacterales bacterium]